MVRFISKHECAPLYTLKTKTRQSTHSFKIFTRINMSERNMERGFQNISRLVPKPFVGKRAFTLRRMNALLEIVLFHVHTTVCQCQ